MKMILVSKFSLNIEQSVKIKMSVLMSPSKSLIRSRWVTYECARLIANHFIKSNFLNICDFLTAMPKQN